MKTFIVGNWKMNQDLRQIKDFFAAFPPPGKTITSQVWIAPQAIHLTTLMEESKGSVVAGAQNCGPAGDGAHTGELSPAGLAELGAEFVIIGHSERRTLYGEDARTLAAKISAARQAGLKIIYCVGESLAERQKNQGKQSVLRQIREVRLQAFEGLLVAYEPLWAIGTGHSATPVEAQEMHRQIRQELGDGVPLLYGGSVKPDNIEGLLACPDIDGALVGGASLNAGSFGELCLKASLAKKPPLG